MKTKKILLSCHCISYKQAARFRGNAGSVVAPGIWKSVEDGFSNHRSPTMLRADLCLKFCFTSFVQKHAYKKQLIFTSNVDSVDVNSWHRGKLISSVKPETLPETFFMMFKVENISLFISYLKIKLISCSEKVTNPMASDNRNCSLTIGNELSVDTE